MFIGRHDITMDGKGRISLPSKWRDVFQEMDPHRRAFITRAPSKPCCRIYPFSTFVPKLKEHSAGLSVIDSEDQVGKIRDLMLDADEGSFDEQWRIVVPPRLRKELSLGSTIVAVSVFDGIELWNPVALNGLKAGAGHGA